MYCTRWPLMENHGTFMTILTKPGFSFLQVLVPLLSNQRNHEHWPEVVSQDVLRHAHTLKNNVYVISGQVKGRTLLPLPVGGDQVTEAVELDERFETDFFSLLTF